MIRIDASFGTILHQVFNSTRRNQNRDVEVRHFSEHMKKDIGWYNSSACNRSGLKPRIVIRDHFFR